MAVSAFQTKHLDSKYTVFEEPDGLQEGFKDVIFNLVLDPLPRNSAT